MGVMGVILRRSLKNASALSGENLLVVEGLRNVTPVTPITPARRITDEVRTEVARLKREIIRLFLGGHAQSWQTWGMP